MQAEKIVIEYLEKSGVEWRETDNEPDK
jgi:hypothetical protein